MQISFFLSLERERERRWCAIDIPLKTSRQDRMYYSKKDIDPKNGSTTRYLNAVQSHCTQLLFVSDAYSSIVRLIKEHG